MTPVLSVRDLTTSFRVGYSWRAVVRNLSFDVHAQETLAIVGESGSGKSVAALSVMRLLAGAGEPRRRQRAAPGSGIDDARRRSDAAGSRRRRRDDLSGADDEPEPDLSGRRADRGSDHLSRREKQDGRARGGVEAARPGPHAERRAPLRRSAAPLLRRHAAARDDRDGARGEAETLDRRRADNGARRHHPGPDPRPHQERAGGGGHVGALHHARHGRGRRGRRPHAGDVSRRGGRGGGDGGRVRAPEACLYAHADRRRAAAGLHARLGPACEVRRRRQARPQRRAPRRNRGRESPCWRSGTSPRGSTCARGCSGAGAAPCTPSRRSRSISRLARRWRWSANRAAANRRPAARSCGWSSRPAAMFCSTG